MHCMFSLALTVQLEYINHLLQFFKNISYYAGIMLNAFSDLLCSKLCWHNRLVPTRDWPIMLIFLPIMLCCSAHKIYLLCSRIRIVLSLLSLFMYKFA